MNPNVLDELRQYRLEFIEQLPNKLNDIASLLQLMNNGQLNAEQHQTLQRQVHSLVGSAGTFGLPRVSDAARVLEASLDSPLSSAYAHSRSAFQQLESVLQEEINVTAPTLKASVPVPLHRKPLIYLVDDDVMQAKHLAEILLRDNYRVQHFDALADFNAALMGEQENPDAVIMDMVFPESDTAGAQAIEHLRSHSPHCPPVIFLSVRDDINARLAALRSGASRYLVKPVDAKKLLYIMDQLTYRIPDKPYRVMLVDDDPLLLALYESYLQMAGIEVRTESQPLSTLSVLRGFNPDVLVLDVYMPEVSGPELAALIREDELYANLPILFLSAESDIGKQLQALNLGGDDFLLKPVQSDHFVAAVIARAKRAYQNHGMIMRLERMLYEREREHLALDQHAIVSIADKSGNIIYANDRFCEISGYRRDELLGLNHRLIKSDQHSTEFYQQLWQTIGSGNIWHGEVCNRKKNGGLYWVESTITPFLDSHGKPYQYVSIRTDITRVKQLEQEAQIAAERLRRSQVFANIGTWDWNIQTGELFWSECIAPLFGYPMGELDTTYENFINAVHPDDREYVSAAVTDCVRQGKTYDIEHRVLWPDDQLRWVQERGDVVRDAQGMPLRMLGVIMDIHDRKMAENAQHESEQKFRNLFELSPVGISLNTLNGRFVEFNDALLNIIGYSKEECRSLTYFQITPVKYINEEAQNTERLKTTGCFGPYEKEYIHKQGHLVPVLLNAMLVQDAAGNQLIWSIIQDISERKKSEQALIEAREQAERANRAKSDFLSSMSHELRTPMNAILGFAQILEFDDQLDAVQLDNIHEIIKAGKHLLQLINEVLDLAKVESGTIDLSLEPVELAPLLQDCFSLLQPLSDARSIRLTHVLEGIAVRADHVRLKQVLLNLLSNAIKYNREGGSVHISSEKVGETRLRITVSDTGFGIRAEKMNELFLPFSRLDAENFDIEGTGIGLTISRRLIEMMGGDIGVDSREGEGSRFWIALPQETTLNYGMDMAVKAPGQLDGNGHQYLVLYIEDNPSNLKLISQLLGRLPHIHLITAHNAQWGLELAIARQPELILLDINMPGMDGYQALRILQANERLKNVPVLALTANAMPRDIKRGIAAGFADYLSKPIDVVHFYQVIDRFLIKKNQ